MKSVIISGRSGYFGSLASSYLNCMGVDVFSAGRHATDDYKFDLDRPAEFSELKVNRQVDTFIHAAATNEVDCVRDPYTTVTRNVTATRSALDFCVKNEIKNFIYISTFHVYGANGGNIHELTSPRPLNDYGLTHLMAEEFVNMYHRKGLVRGTSFRPSNMFDPPLSISDFGRWSLIPFSFCREAVNSRKIVLKSHGLQQRNFVSVRDIVTSILLTVDGKIDSTVVNVPGVDTLSVRGFAYLVQKYAKEILDIDVQVIYPDGENNEPALQYESKHIDPVKLGFSRVDDHVRQFLELVQNEKV